MYDNMPWLNYTQTDRAVMKQPEQIQKKPKGKITLFRLLIIIIILLCIFFKISGTSLKNNGDNNYQYSESYSECYEENNEDITKAPR